MISSKFFTYGFAVLFLLSLTACSESSKSGVSAEDSQILEIDVPSDSSDSDNSVDSSSSIKDSISSSEAKSTEASSESKTSESSETSSETEPGTSSSSAGTSAGEQSSSSSTESSSSEELLESSSSVNEQGSSSSESKTEESSSSDETEESSSSTESSSSEELLESSSSVEFCAEGSFDPKTQLCDTRDGQVYSMVTINNVTWMKQNLNYAMDGSACYGNSNDNCLKHGRLYSTNAAATACPAGWDLPTKSQMLSLGTGYYDETYGYIMTTGGTDLKSTSGWNNRSNGNSGNGKDTKGFTALPAGKRLSSGSFSMKGELAAFWSSTKVSGARYIMGLYNTHSDMRIDYYGYNTSNYYSIRCVKQ